MDEHYKPQAIEAEVQAYWRDNQSFKAVEDSHREKFYCLSMFPYPSGKLHMGHVRNYTIGDVISRYQRMQGKNVLQPMGWDAFGLPAENAAMDNQVPPSRWTYQNIDYMRGQLKRLGFAYDWDREIATCRPDYYRWEQWFFTRLYEKGLVYKKTATVNWDPVDQTVLANEQVIDGRGWRSGALVEQKQIPQWFLRITAYADELLEGLDNLPGWPDAVLLMQRNWIGRSEGVEVDFQLQGRDDKLRIFTTRPDTILGASYMAVAPEHPLALTVADTNADIAAFLQTCRQTGTSEAILETIEKQGMSLGLNVIHPVSHELVPVWVANFVLMRYGTGAVMSVPGHDQRDWEFAKKYDLDILPVIYPADGGDLDIESGAYTEKGILKNSGRFDGLTSEQAFTAIAEFLEAHDAGRRKTHYRLRDWGISRQRYWGCPVPMFVDKAGNSSSVPAEDLPVELPEDVEFTGVRSPLNTLESFQNVIHPQTGERVQRETDTLDTFFESSWYFARYCCPDNKASMLDARARFWLPVDQYIGGIEHAVLHLLYARFFHKLMRDEGLIDTDEPFTNLLTQGMVVAETFYREEQGRKIFFNHKEVAVERDAKGRLTGATLRADGKPVTVGGIEKMSKSKNNGVDPQDMIERYGADTVRLFMMSNSPPEQSLEWSDAGIEGSFRFLRRYWKFARENYRRPAPYPAAGDTLTETQRQLRCKIHQTIAKVNDDIGRRYTFNTAIAAVMELINALSRRADTSENGRAIRHEGLMVSTLLLSPIVPHITDAVWRHSGHDSRIIDAAWPEVDEAALAQDTLSLIVQVNGKKRGQISVPVEATEDVQIQAALANTQVQRNILGRPVIKTIVVPGKLINIVVKPAS